MNSNRAILLSMLANVVSIVGMTVFGAVLSYRDTSGLGLYWFIALLTWVLSSFTIKQRINNYKKEHHKHE